MSLTTALAACAPSSVQRADTTTVSIAPLAYAVRAVIGDSADINVLTPAGASPETYQPTPAQLTALSESRLYVKIGTLGFERTQLEKLTANMPHLICVNASKGITPIEDDHGHHSDGGDPHTWTSPANMKVIAANICHAFIELDTTRTRAFIDRLHRFSTHLDSIDAAIRQRLNGAPTRTFLIYHPALAYFAKAYGLRQLSVEHDGKDASAERMAQLIETCRREKVRTVFIQKEYSGQTARAIAREIGAEVVEINPLSADWESEILNIADALGSPKTAN